ncbi:DUF2309 domain-containing protein [Sandaracinobacteroides saxicola]|uniref:Probable inorganic carbon transporter subunit DabA n=2 Tax=Sandaracinobacteroides saxicola TaxID=2759707 RepID=A0A7G5IMH2_9SPHN|nr:DUF2309 domain-containing protein [Sandaracinobacteroides saxicola]
MTDTAVATSIPLAEADPVATACARIAPLWPLKAFVAVNPFLGLTDLHFGDAARLLHRVAGIDMLPARAFWTAMRTEGRISDADLAQAAQAHGTTFETVTAALAAAPVPPSTAGRIATVAEVLDRLADGDRQASRTAFMIDEIAKFAAAWFDEGQAAWRLPGATMGLYAAWRATAAHDRNPAAMGIRTFQATVAGADADPLRAIQATLDEIGMPANARADYLHRALLDIAGWAGVARWHGWQAGLKGESDPALVDLLAIRVVWGLALYRAQDKRFHDAWRLAMAEAGHALAVAPPAFDEIALGLVLQDAYEIAVHRHFSGLLARGELARADGRPEAQVAFCIDVRSEPFRRALEAQAPGIETIGFAGFFGFAIEYVPIGRETGGAQCPVLLAPGVTVCEGLAHAREGEEAEALGIRLLRRRAVKAWKAFKLAAVSTFAFVETIGLSFAVKIGGDALARTRPAPDPRFDNLDPDAARRLTPVIEAKTVGGRPTGFPPELRLQSAETVLRAMSMTENFARLVVLAGHGSTTVNNPHAAGLDCGACGGHTGEANARVAAAILNDPLVRAGLPARGIHVPDDTIFVAGLHDTTTDAVTLYDDDAPASHAEDLARLRRWLAAAGAATRRERAPTLALAPGADIDAAVAERARDWAQVRPEWALANNAAFIAAPRARTYGLDLGGRAFLHSYDWRKDSGFKILELILTAPMVVASWINLQYYASTANNAVFGAGNKVLHNVAGALGVIEGNAGDLRVGLPWQSVHDGTRFMHEPVRLTVAVDAPREAIDAVLANHPQVAALVRNRWLHLWCIADGGVAAVD